MVVPFEYPVIKRIVLITYRYPTCTVVPIRISFIDDAIAIGIKIKVGNQLIAMTKVVRAALGIPRQVETTRADQTVADFIELLQGGDFDQTIVVGIHYLIFRGIRKRNEGKAQGQRQDKEKMMEKQYFYSSEFHGDKVLRYRFLKTSQIFQQNPSDTLCIFQQPIFFLPFFQYFLPCNTPPRFM
jgi:hypothetical protein